ncbi:MAG TPA: 50S ribosomal protein L23 [Candidatus Caccopulliclostridium gallistercoris]|uniref:Large ribosomal subunit protein uL23 n=1 Tax=Candidatus Caccopulliclostridium gallistercoris TaxID=2840719 RepID=A0A9D1SY31_9FIRM|nr:50S ribosomal protein L23 [Candidatus Caccopulliclostridium gallistercoris]
MNAYEIIKKPLMSEKSYAGIQNKVYTFVVDKRAGKVEIKKAVEEIFKVQVEKVNTLIVKGKTVSRNTKSGVTVGNTGDYKKAIVTLTKDSKPIAFFESLS